MSAVLLDNEAVQALLRPDPPKHRTVIATLDGMSTRARRRKDRTSRWVPTTVRVEAGWRRTDPAATPANRLHLRDHELDRTTADLAAALVAAHRVSPADAHLGATVATIASTAPMTGNATGGSSIVVLTSDPGDIDRVCPPGAARVIRI